MIAIHYIYRLKEIAIRLTDKMDEGVGDCLNIDGTLYQVFKICWSKASRDVEVYVKKGD